jgi:hypothetical protein
MPQEARYKDVRLSGEIILARCSMSSGGARLRAGLWVRVTYVYVTEFKYVSRKVTKSINNYTHPSVFKIVHSIFSFATRAAKKIH